MFIENPKEELNQFSAQLNFLCGSNLHACFIFNNPDKEVCGNNLDVMLEGFLNLIMIILGL